MAKITYQDKVDLYENANVQHINKVIADDMNEIKEAVNDNENKILLAISDTAPSTCATGDLYYNTTSKKIFEATGTNTWGTTGTNPTPNTIYILFDTKTTYSYDGNDLVSVGGGGAEIAVSTTEPTGEDADSVKLWINPNEAPSGSLNPISNTYGVAQDKGYSQEYLNGKLKDVYSTDEVKTNKVWIDGKPIYRKTYVFSNLTSSQSSIDITNLNIDTFLPYEAIGTWSDGGAINWPYYLSNTDNGRVYKYNSTIVLISYSFPDYNNRGLKVTLYYTKTTD